MEKDMGGEGRWMDGIEGRRWNQWIAVVGRFGGGQQGKILLGVRMAGIKARYATMSEK